MFNGRNILIGVSFTVVLSIAAALFAETIVPLSSATQPARTASTQPAAAHTQIATTTHAQDVPKPHSQIATTHTQDASTHGHADAAHTQASVPTPTSAPIAPPAPLSVASGPLEVFPGAIALHSARDAQSIVVRLTRPDGVTLDVTSQAVFTLTDGRVARIDHAMVYPLADGQGQLQIKYAERSVSLPLTVNDAKVDPPVSFHLDVMPVFFRAGCNSGACHGSARGKDGFHLSLFGFDHEGDYYRLTHEIAGRRVNLALPKESLILKKATGKVPHTGGTRFNDDTAYYATLLRWIEAGAVKDADTIKAVSLVVLPRQALLEGEGSTQQFIARARYSDGSERDVTRLAIFSTSNDNSATVSVDGLVTSAKRGEAFIMARFATFTVGSQVIVIPKDIKYEFPKVKEENYIDTLVDAKLKKMRIVPSALCSDEVFMRRAYLDIIGLLPTVAEHDRFMASYDIHKREKLVDELLGRKEFVDMWVMKWAELLQIRSNNDKMSYKAALLYYEWLQDRIEHNVPFDQIVQELLGASGGTFKNPASNYYQIDTDPLKTAENTAQVFMGMRIQCSQCHNHPFDRWTMDDYYSFAAFFSQIARKPGEDPRETIISDGGGSEVRNPVTNKVELPKFLGADSGLADTKGTTRRQALAKWIASPQNPWFARNLANMVWAHFLGHGIVDPVDDVRASNPPSNPELLDALGEKFQEYHYDFKRLVRDICTSRTYQLASETNATNAGDERNFSHAVIRRVRAEVLLDCICEVTGSHEKFKGLPVGSRAVQIADGQTTDYFLTTFGRATRETVCSCEVKMEPNLSQALTLLNGDTIQRKIRDGQTLKKFNESKDAPLAKVRDLYVSCLTRPPTRQELESLEPLMSSASTDVPKSIEDLFWALLNSQEFIFNH